VLGISTTIIGKNPCPEAFTKDIKKADLKKKYYYPALKE